MQLSSSHVDDDIRKNRTAHAVITLLRPDGNPAVDQEVLIEQKTHKFLFGITGSSDIALANGELTGQEKSQAQIHAEKLLHLFNFVTLPFYWGRFEPEPGKPDTKRLKAAAKFFTDHGCLVKGHPLCWHTVCADWLLPMPIEKIIETQLARVRREVIDFSGLIDVWDVINEVVIMPIFDKYDNAVTRMCRKLGRIGIVRETFAAARAADPESFLLINDFDLSAAFECLLEGCLENGIKIDAIGLQSHMHQGYWGVEKTHNILERFARYGLPLHFTESTLVSGKIMPPEIVDLNDYQVNQWPTTPEGEARQAEEVVTHYKTLLAHPSVEAITWWGLTDGGWLKAPSGLLRVDNSTKPAYQALANLLKRDWWLGPTMMRTDARGTLKFRGFLGEYALKAGAKTHTVHLAKIGQVPLTVRL